MLSRVFHAINTCKKSPHFEVPNSHNSQFLFLQSSCSEMLSPICTNNAHIYTYIKHTNIIIQKQVGTKNTFSQDYSKDLNIINKYFY